MIKCINPAPEIEQFQEEFHQTEILKIEYWLAARGLSYLTLENIRVHLFMARTGLRRDDVVLVRLPSGKWYPQWLGALTMPKDDREPLAGQWGYMFFAHNVRQL